MPIRRPHRNARTLRQTMPEAERRLWARLRNRGLGGFRFRRQHTVGPYVADFACVEARLVIECDGEQHGFPDALKRDAARDEFMKKQGWIVLRFWNNEVYDNMDGVLEKILETAENSSRFLKTQAPDDNAE
ncbi:endonuclease domain-containing protein [Hyphococcus sp.]|uniref:endonuclease domain-containing protein n=1 Tax=Hyphococcus sp. TaxID=2038636 RepID=UPI0035C6A14F